MEERPPVPFDSLGLHPDILKGIHDLGYIRPTPVQEQAIPRVMKGDDVIICSQTGSGKTAAFVLPVLHRLLNNPPPSARRVRSLILAPTRELALQSSQQVDDLSRYVSLRGLAVFGGTPMYPQTKALAEGVEIISATPGRLLDHVYEGRIDFGALEVFVLDEADRMMDMGFLPDVERIVSLLPQNRQTLIVSATMPPEILKLVNRISKNPAMIQVGQRATAASGIKHALYPVPQDQKTDLLLRLLRTDAGNEMSSVIVFTRTKQRADKLAQSLQRAGIRVSLIHGDRSQGQRLHALEHFRDGRSQVLVATDIAARGIDIKDISHVINVDVPQSPEDYIHRAGRTARAGATGDAFTFVSPDEELMVTDIEKILGQRIPRVTLPDFNYKKGGGASHGASHGGRHGHGGGQHRGGGRPPRRGGHSGPPRHGHSRPN